MIVSISGTMILNSFTNRSAAIDNAAPYEYVDKKDDEIKKELEKKADKETVNKMSETIDVMDERIYDLWKDRNKSQ